MINLSDRGLETSMLLKGHKVRSNTNTGVNKK